MREYIIAPSLLSANLACLGQEADDVLQAGANWLHLDVMDNHYVPNLTFGPMICQALRQYGIQAPIDVHLMVTPVDQLIPLFMQAGATYITVHPETTLHLDRTIQIIKEHGGKVGIAFNPTTPLNILPYILEKIDMVVLMSVNPGFSGQLFIETVYQKLQEARHMIERYSSSVRLQIDGGIHLHNIQAACQSGADTFVSGSAIFSHKKSYGEVIQNMHALLQAVKFK